MNDRVVFGLCMLNLGIGLTISGIIGGVNQRDFQRTLIEQNHAQHNAKTGQFELRQCK